MDDLAFEELIERIRERTDIVQIISQRVSLDRHYKALCPFHKEKKPKFLCQPCETVFLLFRVRDRRGCFQVSAAV